MTLNQATQMPEIQAFRAIRYNLGKVGSLSNVIAPPYDVIGPGLQDELYRKSPYNVVRLILNKIEPGDDNESNNRYTLALRFLPAIGSRKAFSTPIPIRQFTSTIRNSLRRAKTSAVEDSWLGCGFRRSAKGRSFRMKRPCPAQRSIASC